MFIHIKGSNSVLAGAISRLKALDIYQETLDNPPQNYLIQWPALQRLLAAT